MELKKVYLIHKKINKKDYHGINKMYDIDSFSDTVNSKNLKRLNMSNIKIITTVYSYYPIKSKQI